MSIIHVINHKLMLGLLSTFITQLIKNQWLFETKNIL